MSGLLVRSFGVSIDGFGAGPDQDLDVLTHHARGPVMMKGGTEFRFVTEGIHAALQQARAVAGGRDSRVGGGVSTIRQFLQAGLIDELHLALRPVLLGKGENLFAGIDLRAARPVVASVRAQRIHRIDLGGASGWDVRGDDGNQ